MSEARPGETKGFPILVHLADRRVLVVGDGDEAVAHVQSVLLTGAVIVVIALAPCDALTKLEAGGRIELHRRNFLSRDLEGVRLCIVALPDAEVADAVAAEADANDVLVTVVNRPDAWDFSIPAMHCPPATVGKRSCGVAQSPANGLRSHIDLSVSGGPTVMTASDGDRPATVAGGLSEETAHRASRDAVIGALRMRAVLGSDRVEGEQSSAATSGSARLTKHSGHATLIGAGPGDPELLTLRALRALQQADVVLHDALIDPAVFSLMRHDARRVDVGKRCGRHAMSQAAINGLLRRLALSGAHVVRLKGGDPMVFGRAGEELEALRSAGIAVEVIPGVTAACAAAAQLAVPLTHRGVARSLHFITGHGADGTVPAYDWVGLARVRGTIVAYMASRTMPLVAQRLIDAGMSRRMPAVAIENVSRADERCVFSSLGELGDMLAEQCFNGPTLALIGTVVALARQITGTLACAA
jgi:uroporphyrin-III C-methyltransferase / precorrin-2 dehydrogenase / sirohydrochlorin ferrochelatase